MLSSMRLRRVGLVALIALGVLSMHGLATTLPAQPIEQASGLTSAISPTPADSGHHSGGDGGHGTMTAIGQLCLWLVAGGALFFAGRTVGRALITSTRDQHHRATESATPPTPLGRSPDPTLANVTLRC